RNRTSGITIQLGVPGGSGNADDGPDGARDTIDATVEQVPGTDQDDTLIGTPGPDVLDGKGGNATIDGRAGADQLIGGTGTDTVTYANHTAGVTATPNGTPTSGNT